MSIGWADTGVALHDVHWSYCTQHAGDEFIRGALLDLGATGVGGI